MTRFAVLLTAVASLCLPSLNSLFDLQDDLPDESQAVAPASTEREARSRAILLHELTVGTLQVVHRDLFDDEDSRAIPSSSIEDVFSEMEKQFDVQMKWLTVETDVLNVDHQPETEFEKTAAKALREGQKNHYQRDGNFFRYAAPVALPSQCLKCHVKMRKDNRPRVAGLTIAIPMVSQDARHSPDAN